MTMSRAVQRARAETRASHSKSNLAYVAVLERELDELEQALRRAHDALDREQGHTGETWRDRERYGGR
jgi:hypothetical protein